MSKRSLPTLPICPQLPMAQSILPLPAICSSTSPTPGCPDNAGWLTRRSSRHRAPLAFLQPNYRYAYREYFDDYTHVTVWSSVSFAELLVASGFEIVEVRPRFLPLYHQCAIPVWPFVDPRLSGLAGQTHGQAMLVVARPAHRESGDRSILTFPGNSANEARSRGFPVCPPRDLPACVSFTYWLPNAGRELARPYVRGNPQRADRLCRYFGNDAACANVALYAGRHDWPPHRNSVRIRKRGGHFLTGLLTLALTAAILPGDTAANRQSKLITIVAAAAVLFLVSSNSFAQREWFAAVFALPMLAVFVKQH